MTPNIMAAIAAIRSIPQAGHSELANATLILSMSWAIDELLGYIRELEAELEKETLV